MYMSCYDISFRSLDQMAGSVIVVVFRSEAVMKGLASIKFMISLSVCLSVSLSVCLSVHACNSKNISPIDTRFFARSSPLR